MLACVWDDGNRERMFQVSGNRQTDTIDRYAASSNNIIAEFLGVSDFDESACRLLINADYVPNGVDVSLHYVPVETGS